MKKLLAIIYVLLFSSSYLKAQDWAGIPVPAYPGVGNQWQLQSDPSDDFNYTFNATNQWSNFGSGKWYNFYHNQWDGPGTTYWQYDHVSVDGSDLVLRASRNPSTAKMGVEGVNAGCITGNHRVNYPVYVEASVSVANITLASDVWLLSPDDTQEIDIIECYGGASNGNAFFAKFIHISHHSFVRNPFQDYQPRDFNSWWEKAGVSSWGDYCWNGGNRKYVRVGVYWVGPKHFEYYVDGELVRVLYDKAFASKVNGTWYYTYPTMTNGQLDFENGYQKVVQYATGSTYSFNTLQAASNTSSVSVIDPYNYQNGNGFTKDLDIIINVESQDWHVQAGRTPTTAELNDPTKNRMKVDWLRVYKPVPNTGGGTGSEVIIQAESFGSTGGTYDDSSSGGPGYGVNDAGTIINFVNGGDWVTYPITIPEEGAYEVKYRYATPVTGTSVAFEVSGIPFFTTSLPATGGWGTYQDLVASQTANFTAGNHQLKLTAGTAAWQWNMDKITLTRVGPMTSRTTDVLEEERPPQPKLFPNPAAGQFAIATDQPLHVRLYNAAGAVVITLPEYKEGAISVEGLRPGMYHVVLQNSEGTYQQKLMVTP
ncbi:carbohydrate-binding protein [Marinoscillum furvescens]|uniref:Agarase n=1 Tax=Marinoscillum furvescens DSM 4134 TaxID=1122208 RepID=A0A3D9KX89_MARFU|nr:carbohydrate-binding protein [Marinoscillum furvescens]RED93003.1 agarase [Marinoscillum furvescens DSM 4134]